MFTIIASSILGFFAGFFAFWFLNKHLIQESKRVDTILTLKEDISLSNKDDLITSSPEIVCVSQLESEELGRYLVEINKRHASLEETARRQSRMKEPTAKIRLNEI